MLLPAAAAVAAATGGELDWAGMALAAPLLQAWSPGTYFAGNPVSWSLSCESFFYALFPLAIARVAAMSPARLVSHLAGVLALLMILPVAARVVVSEQLAAYLLDGEGLEGLSMRRLGQRLGSAATAMYWHVQSKENLIALASDQVWAAIPLLDPQEVGWREAAAQLARTTHKLGVKHHWPMPAITSALVYGTGMARHRDHSYAILETAGFTGADLDWAVNTLFNFVLGATYQDAAQTAILRRSRQASGDLPQRLRDAAAKADQIVAQFPRLQARAQAQREADTDPTPPRSTRSNSVSTSSSTGWPPAFPRRPDRLTQDADAPAEAGWS